MDPHEPFLKAVLADRQDDLPRLVYADWLEETGEPANVARAHFIRTQIHLETTDPRSELHHELKALETRILDWYLDEWQHDLPEPLWNSDRLKQVMWRRGFPDNLGPLSVHEFRRYAHSAFARLPLDTLHLADFYTGIRFDEFPNLRSLVKLKLGPQFRELTETVTDITTAATVRASITSESLTAADVFPRLRHLDLSENLLDDEWLVSFAVQLARCSFASTLDTLILSGNFGITDAGANVLATVPGLDRLKSLRLRDTGITSAGKGMLKKRFGSRLG